MNQYVIWSNEHRAWWRPDQRCYTPNLRQAGAYSKMVAEWICQQADIGGHYSSRYGEPPEIAIDLRSATNIVKVASGGRVF